MIIKGNTVGTTMPRADYAQTDPSKADYIKNKPEEAIKKAQDTANNAKTAADNAQTTADSKVSKSGDTMTGGLTVPFLSVKALDAFPQVVLGGNARNEGLVCFNADLGLIQFRNTDVNTGFYEEFYLPYASPVNETTYYNILTTKNPVTIAQGGTGGSTVAQAAVNLGITSQNVFQSFGEDGNFTLSAPSTYPTKPGVYRITSASLEGLPSGTNGYGTLVIFNGGSYVMHLYIDAAKNLYIGQNGAENNTTIKAPTTWNRPLLNVLSTKDYGTSLPSSGETGQIYFLKG